MFWLPGQLGSGLDAAVAIIDHLFGSKEDEDLALN